MVRLAGMLAIWGNLGALRRPYTPRSPGGLLESAEGDRSRRLERLHDRVVSRDPLLDDLGCDIMFHLDDHSLTIAGVERHLDPVNLPRDGDEKRPHGGTIGRGEVVLSGLVLLHAYILPRAVRGRQGEGARLLNA